MKQIILLLLLFVLNVNAQVTQEWVVRYKGPTDSYANHPIAIGVDNNGNIYVAVNTLVQLVQGGYWDFATVKYNSDGVEQWVQIYDGPANQHDRARAMVIDEDGNVYVTGTSVGSASSYEDITTIKYSPQGQQLWENRYSRT